MYIHIYKAGKLHLNADSEAKLKAFCSWLCVSACAWGFRLYWVLTAVMLFGLLIFLWNTTVIHGHISETRGPSWLAVLLKSTLHCPISSVHSNPPPVCLLSALLCFTPTFEGKPWLKINRNYCTYKDLARMYLTLGSVWLFQTMSCNTRNGPSFTSHP